MAAETVAEMEIADVSAIPASQHRRQDRVHAHLLLRSRAVAAVHRR